MGRSRGRPRQRNKLAKVRSKLRLAAAARSQNQSTVEKNSQDANLRIACEGKAGASVTSQEHPNINPSDSDSLDMEMEVVVEGEAQDHVSSIPVKIQSSDTGSSSKHITFESEDDNLPPLVTVISSPEATELPVKGYRVVDIEHVANQYCEMAQHARKCTFAKFKLVKEVRNGLSSVLVHKCEFCDYVYRVETEKELQANDAAVWGSLSIGIGHSQLEELMALIDVPSMSAGNFRAHQRRIGDTWREHLTEKMKENGIEERRLAIAAGDFYKGMVFITVIVDGGWARRSYGHGFSSASGVVVIIGARTNKVLFISIKNKYCYACSRAKSLGKEPCDHVCFVNYKGSSTGMEQTGIVDGFNASLETHDLMYRYFVGDGDSSVFARVREQVSYGRYVEKLECANHAVKCYKGNLHKILKQTRVYPLEERNILKPLIDQLANGARAAIRNADGNVDQLKGDLTNGPKHVLGNHEKCREVCKRRHGQNMYALFGKCQVWKEVQKITDNMVRKADRLVSNVTTNQAERYMGLVAQLAGGKRRNLTSSGGYTYACVGAGLSHISGPKWHVSPWKRLTQKSPGTIFKRVFERRDAAASKRRLAFSNVTAKAKRRRSGANAGPDMEYGPNAADIDIDDEQLQVKMRDILQTLQGEVKTPVDSAALERATVGQRENAKWREARKNRLTASKFGVICNRRDYTPCHNQVKELLYAKPLTSKAVQYGIENESKAVAAYEESTGRIVQECGLFVLSDLPYLGASPDGLVEDDGLLEVKCLPSIGNQTAKEAAMSNTKKNLCITFTNGAIQLKPKHPYWFQIQGQLNITGREWCDLVLFSDGGVDGSKPTSVSIIRLDPAAQPISHRGRLFDTRMSVPSAVADTVEPQITRIHRNRDFWASNMLPKISQFYMECVLPEIADPRLPRGMAIRDPPYIQNAITKNKTECAKRKQKHTEPTRSLEPVDSDEDNPQPIVW